MSVGDPWVAVAMCVWMAANGLWSYRNWRAAETNRKDFQLSKEIREQAVNDAVSIRANEFRVCKTCGAIVQGFCSACTVIVEQK